MIFDLHKIDVPIILSLILTKFFVGFITGLVIPIFPTLIATDFNESLKIGSNLNVTFERTNSSFDYQQLSTLFAIKSVCQILISPFIGYFCEVLGSTKVLLLGTGLTTTTLLLYGLGNKYYILILGRIAESIGNCSINCAVGAFIAYYYKGNNKRGLVSGIVALTLFSGSALGPPYGGLMFQYYGKVVAFLSVLSLNVLQIILTTWLLIYFQLGENCHSGNLERSQIIEIEPNATVPDITWTDVSKPEVILLTVNRTNETSEINNENHTAEETCLEIQNAENTRTSSKDSLTKEKHKIMQFFTDPYFMILIGSYVIMYMPIFIYMIVLPRYMRLTFGSTESQQGLIWILALVGYTLGFLMGILINRKLSKYRHIVLMIAIYLHALGSILIAVMPTWWSLAIPLCFIVNQEMVFDIVVYPLIAKIVEKRHQSKFGLMAAIVWTSIAIVSSIAYYLGPFLFSKIGFLYLNVIILLLGLIYGPLLLFLKRFI